LRVEYWNESTFDINYFDAWCLLYITVVTV
jgi:hypothetical protein